MFMPVYTQTTHNNQKPFYFGGSTVPVVLDLKPSSIHGGGTRETPPKPRKNIPHQKGKPML